MLVTANEIAQFVAARAEYGIGIPITSMENERNIYGEEVSIANIHIASGMSVTPDTFSVMLDNGQLFLVSVTEVPQ